MTSTENFYSCIELTMRWVEEEPLEMRELLCAASFCIQVSPVYQIHRPGQTELQAVDKAKMRVPYLAPGFIEGRTLLSRTRCVPSVVIGRYELPLDFGIFVLPVNWTTHL